MKRTLSSFLKWMPFAAILGIAITLSVNGSKATNTVPTAAATPDVDLANEVQILERYGDDLLAYQKACAQLSKRVSLLQTDIDPLQRKSDDLKARLSQVQNAIREAVRKLKAANQWDNLDATLQASDTQPRLKSILEDFKANMENAASGLSSHANEINIPVESLRKKLAFQRLPNADRSWSIVSATYLPEPRREFVSVACTVQNAIIGINNLLHRKESVHRCDVATCACLSDGTDSFTGFCSGTACSQL